VNEIRELEDKDPIGEEGDVYLQPLNMVPAGKEARAALVEIVKTVLSETNARAKQVDVIEPDDPKTVPDRQHEPSDFNEIRKIFCAAALPGLQADPTTTVRAVYAALQASVVAEGFQVRGDGEPFLRDYLAGLERRMNGLDLATEMHRLRCAALRDLYRRAGVSRFEIVTGQAWVRAGGSPQFRLVAGADEPFLEKNEEVTDGALNLRAPYRVWHPPVFPGDDSEIVPVREV
jgi:hypothetical protein